MRKVTLDSYAGVDRLRIAIGGDITGSEVRRDEGGVAMRLVDPVLSVECDGVDFSSIHPDIIALIGILAFHPILPNEEFELKPSFSVSPNFEKAIRRAWILPYIRVNSPGEASPFTPKRGGVLSYGGGIDSLAASIMFPDLPLVHETPLPSRHASYSDIVNKIVTDERAENFVVFDNLRQLFTVWGLPLWVSVYIASLILEPKYIVSGSELTGTYLLAGKRYLPRHQNIWYRVFETIGVDVLPTSFLSEVGNAKIVSYSNRMDDAAYCQKIDRKDCGRCTKCLRRRMIRAMFDPSEMHLVDDFVQSDQIHAFLRTRPLYYADVFVHAAARQVRPTWVNEHIKDLLEKHESFPFHEAYYSKAFDHFGYPLDLRERAERSMGLAGLKAFTESDDEEFTNFLQ
ncbi:DUF6395 domain-containing protein [Arthrobacter sp. 260]|uniref:DUF6395 domain-containing protein n=1 Tax=Arthrobacter sp. 260 TaxID=2735314 RepID=UPI0014912DD0|nr:DUF6395 domain-containing protein [Arthrobacter sp. 260]NOJ60385.1 hypothetical protein [Arthrobacter sp. 260]